MLVLPLKSLYNTEEGVPLPALSDGDSLLVRIELEATQPVSISLEVDTDAFEQTRLAGARLATLASNANSTLPLVGAHYNSSAAGLPAIELEECHVAPCVVQLTLA